MYNEVTGLAISVNLDKIKPIWVWVEHQLNGTVFYECVTRLERMQEMREGRRNNQWRNWVRQYPDHGVVINVRMVGNDAIELERAMMDDWGKRGHTPDANARGLQLDTKKRVIRTSDGRTFETQMHAARGLGVSQSAISQALRGFNRTVAGLTIRYYHDTDIALRTPEEATALVAAQINTEIMPIRKAEMLRHIPPPPPPPIPPLPTGEHWVMPEWVRNWPKPVTVPGNPPVTYLPQVTRGNIPPPYIDANGLSIQLPYECVEERSKHYGDATSGVGYNDRLQERLASVTIETPEKAAKRQEVEAFLRERLTNPPAPQWSNDYDD